MKASPRRHIRSQAIALTTALALLTASAVRAGNVWDGGGGDNNWGTGANWNPDGSPAPGSGNDLFFAGSTRLNSFNNYTAFDDWRSITFNAGAGSFNITGNAIDLFGKIENLSSNAQTFGLASIALNSATANEFNPVNGDITITSANIFTNGNQLKVFGNNGFTLSFAAGTNIQQSGSVAINQNSTVIYNSAHSYTGDTFVNAGKLQFASGASAAASIIRIGDTSGTANAEVDLTVATGGQTLTNTFVARAGSSGIKTIDSQNTSGTNTLSGTIALDAPLTLKQSNGGTLNLSGSFVDIKAQTFTVDASGTVNISESLGSSLGAGGSLVKMGIGTLLLTNTSNNYTGTNNATLNANGTQIGGGTLAIAGEGSLGLAPAGAYNNVQFTGSATLRSDASISLNANRNISIASGATAHLDSNGNTFTINGVVNGGGNVNINGTGGTVVFTGANTYTGTTTVSAGTLQIGNGGTTGTLGTGAVTDNSALVFNRSNSVTVSNDISGTGSVTQSGAGTTILTGTNSYGATTISAGTLQIGSGGATGTLGTGNVTNNAALVFNRASGVANNFVLTNAISGSGTLTQSGANIITLSSANSYTGATTINSGILRVTANDALGTNAAGTIVNSGGTLRLFGVNYTTAEALSINGTGVGGVGALQNIGGSSTYAGQVTAASNATISSTGGTLTLTGGLVKNGTTLTITGNGSVIVNNTGISGASASSDLVVDAGTLLVNATSNYNGPTTVQNVGTLVANAAITTTKVTVSSDSTLSGTSSITTAGGGTNYVVLNGALIVGDSTLGSPVASQFDLQSSGAAGSTVMGTASGSYLYFDFFSNVGDNTAVAASADRIKLFGVLDNSLGGTLVLGNPNALSSFAYGDKWTLFDLSGGGNPSISSPSFSLDYSALGLAPGLAGSFNNANGVFTIVPEPSRALLIFGAALAGLVRRRRRLV